jgi:hypothetical protein
VSHRAPRHRDGTRRITRVASPAWCLELADQLASLRGPGEGARFLWRDASGTMPTRARGRAVALSTGSLNPPSMGRDVIPAQKRQLARALILLGAAILIAGFIYDALFAGIPYQDPTPALQARYDFHSHVASLIRWSGLGLSLIGLVFLTINRRRGAKTANA